MSEYTREEVLRLIEENGGPEGLDLAGKDLSGIDLSREAIEAELEKARERAPYETPVWYSDWPGGINLAGTELQGACLMEANLQGANLRNAELLGAFLMEANLQGADLRGTELLGAILGLADFQGADLGGANLQRAYLSYSHLEKVDFFGAESLEGACFYNAFLDDTRLKREQLGRAIGEELEGEYDKAKEAYLALKNNFAEIGRYRDESWAYVKERQMGKMMHYPQLARVYYGDELPENPSAWRLAWFYIRHTAKWLSDWFVELLCGYGESLSRVLAWMLLVVLGFAAYYQISHAVVTSSQDVATSFWDH